MKNIDLGNHVNLPNTIVQFQDEVSSYITADDIYGYAGTDFACDWLSHLTFPGWDDFTNGTDNNVNPTVPATSLTIGNHGRDCRHACMHFGCMKTFGRRSDMMLHYRKHLQHRLEYPFENCSKKFYRVDKLHDHQRRVHKSRH